MRIGMTVALSACLVIQLSAQAPSPASPATVRFEVVSIRPVDDEQVGRNSGVFLRPGGRMEAIEAMLSHVVHFAYELYPVQRIVGGESLLTKRFTIRAKAANDIPVPRRSGAFDTSWEQSPFNEMARTMLAERFALLTRWREDIVQVQVITLATAGRTGPNLRRRSTPCVQGAVLAGPAATSTSDSQRCSVSLLNGVLTGAIASPGRFAEWLSAVAGVRGNAVPFVDETGLEGSFDVTTRFNILTLPGYAGFVNPTRMPYEDYPSFIEALRRDLGLRVESRRRPMRTLVIDHIEAPTAN